MAGSEALLQGLAAPQGSWPGLGPRAGGQRRPFHRLRDRLSGLLSSQRRAEAPAAAPAEAAPAGGPAGLRALAIGAGVAGLSLSLVLGLSRLLQLPWQFGAVAFGLQYGFFLLQAWPQRSEKLFDASGSLTHLSVVLTAMTSESVRSPRQLVVGVLAVIWCTRLGTFLFNRIARDAKDERFTALKKNFFIFSTVWSGQAAWVFLLDLPVVLANAEQLVQPAVGPLDLLGWSAWAVGFLVEAIADAQKFSFRSDSANKGRFITEGLWRYSRHPNYFGEILMWIGICTSCSSCFWGWRWLGWICPVFNAWLLLFVTGVPLLEKAGEEKWGSEPAYQHYMKNTSCIVPWLPAPPMKGSEPAAVETAA